MVSSGGCCISPKCSLPHPRGMGLLNVLQSVIQNINWFLPEGNTGPDDPTRSCRRKASTAASNYAVFVVCFMCNGTGAASATPS